MHWWLGLPAVHCLGRPQMHGPPWLAPPVLHREERIRQASGSASGPGQGNPELDDRWTPEVSGATSPREPGQSTWTGLNVPSPGSCSVPSRNSGAREDPAYVPISTVQ